MLYRCGDAWAICKTLAELVQGSALREYVGVDLSSPAIGEQRPVCSRPLCLS